MLYEKNYKIKRLLDFFAYIINEENKLVINLKFPCQKFLFVLGKIEQNNIYY